MDRCLTEQEVDAAMLIAFAGGCLTLIASVACLMAWLPASAIQSRTPSYLNGIAPLFSAGCLILLTFRGQIWLVAIVVGTMLAFVPVVLVLRQRASAFSAGVELAPAWRGSISVIKYGGPVLAVVGAIVAVSSLAWVLPANLC